MAVLGNPFTINLPKGWEDQTMYTFMGPEDSGVQHILTLSIDRYAGKTGLSEYAAERRDKVLEMIPNAEVLKDEAKDFPSGTKAYEVVFKMVPADGTVIFRKMVFIIKDGNGYTFAINFSKKTIKTIGVEVDGIIDSLVPLTGKE